MRSLLGLDGLDVMVGAEAGGVVSTTKVMVAAVPRLPASSTSATRKVWEPSESAVEVNGLVQAANAPESMAQA